MTIDEYITEVQKELDQAVIDVYRLEGALAMLQKMKADSAPPANQEQQEIQNDD